MPAADSRGLTGLANRLIRKLPPPRDPAESASFPERALTEILSAFRRERGGLWLWDGRAEGLSLAASRGGSLPDPLSAPRGEHRPPVPEDRLLLESAGLVHFHPLDLPGRPIGLLAVSGARTAATEGDDEDLGTVAQYLGGLLGGDLLTRRMRETDFELRYRLWELESLYDIGLAIGASLDPATVAEEILLRSLSLISARQGSVDLLDEPALHLDFGGACLGEPTLSEVAAGSPLLSRSIDGIPILAVPIRTEARSLGVLAVAGKEGRGGDLRPFDANDQRTLTLLAAQAAIALESARLHREALEKERMERELAVAAQIQTETLPKSMPPSPGLTLYGRTRPTRAVGGDLYEFLPLSGGRLVAVLADVSGKGVPAALLVSTIATGLHMLADEPFDPVAVVTRIDRLLLRYSAVRKFATFALALVDPAADRLSWLSAGHNPALLVRECGAVEELGSTGVPLGMFEGSARRLLEVPFRKGDRLVVYSDGISEATSPRDEEYGLPRLTDLVRELRLADEATLGAAIFQDVLDFAAEAPQYDDQTLVLVTHR